MTSHVRSALWTLATDAFSGHFIFGSLLSLRNPDLWLSKRIKEVPCHFLYFLAHFLLVETYEWKKYTRSRNRKKNRKNLKMNKFRVGCPREKKLYDLSKRCIIKSIDTERVKDNFWNSYAFNFYGVSSQTQTIIMVQKPLQTNLLHWISEWTKLVAINFKDCTDLLLWEKDCSNDLKMS